MRATRHKKRSVPTIMLRLGKLWINSEKDEVNVDSRSKLVAQLRNEIAMSQLLRFPSSCDFVDRPCFSRQSNFMNLTLLVVLLIGSTVFLQAPGGSRCKCATSQASTREGANENIVLV